MKCREPVEVRISKHFCQIRRFGVPTTTSFHGCYYISRFPPFAFFPSRNNPIHCIERYENRRCRGYNVHVGQQHPSTPISTNTPRRRLSRWWIRERCPASRRSVMDHFQSLDWSGGSETRPWSAKGLTPEYFRTLIDLISLAYVLLCCSTREIGNIDGHNIDGQVGARFHCDGMK